MRDSSLVLLWACALAMEHWEEYGMLQRCGEDDVIYSRSSIDTPRTCIAPKVRADNIEEWVS